MFKLKTDFEGKVVILLAGYEIALLGTSISCRALRPCYVSRCNAHTSYDKYLIMSIQTNTYMCW